MIRKLILTLLLLIAPLAYAGSYFSEQHGGTFYAVGLEPAVLTLTSFNTTTGAYAFTSTRAISASSPIYAVLHADGSTPSDGSAIKSANPVTITAATGTLAIPTGAQGRYSFAQFSVGEFTPVVTGGVVSAVGVSGKNYNPGFYWPMDIDNLPDDGSGDIAFLQNSPLCDGGDGQEYYRGGFAALDWGEAEPTKGDDRGITRFVQMLDWFDAGNCSSVKFGKKRGIFSIRGLSFAAQENWVRSICAPAEHGQDVAAWQPIDPGAWKCTIPGWETTNPAVIAFEETNERFAAALGSHPQFEGFIGPESAIGRGIETVSPTFTTDAHLQAVRDHMDHMLALMPNTIGYPGANFFGGGGTAAAEARRDLHFAHVVAEGNMGVFYPDPWSNTNRPIPATTALEWLAENKAVIPSIAGGQNPSCARFRSIAEYMAAYAEVSWSPPECAIAGGDCAYRPSHILIKETGSCVASTGTTEATIAAELALRGGDNSMSGVCPTSIAGACQ